MKITMDQGSLRWVLYPFIIFIIFFFASTLTEFPTRLHEFGHYAYGTVAMHGNCTMTFDNLGGGNTSCNFADQNINSFQISMFSMAGFMTEWMVYAVLLIIPYTSLIGGYLFYSSLTEFYRYDVDLKNLPINFLLTPQWAGILDIIGVIILILSAFIYVYFWEKLNEKSVKYRR